MFYPRLELGRDFKLQIVLAILDLWFLLPHIFPCAPNWDRLLYVIQGYSISTIGSSIARIHDSRCKSLTDIASEEVRIPGKKLERSEVVVCTFDVIFWENRRTFFPCAQLLELLDILKNHSEEPHKEPVELG